MTSELATRKLEHVHIFSLLFFQLVFVPGPAGKEPLSSVSGEILARPTSMSTSFEVGMSNLTMPKPQLAEYRWKKGHLTSGSPRVKSKVLIGNDSLVHRR